MYIRRKVFSLGEGNIDYDYNLYQALYSDYEDDYEDPIERFYSDAFDEGFDFYVQRMFAEDASKKARKEQYKTQYQNYISQGYTHEAATKKAAEDVQGINSGLRGTRQKNNEAVANSASTTDKSIYRTTDGKLAYFDSKRGGFYDSKGKRVTNIGGAAGNSKDLLLQKLGEVDPNGGVITSEETIRTNQANAAKRGLGKLGLYNKEEIQGLEDSLSKTKKAAEEAAKQAKAKQEGLEKSLKRWKVGAGIGAGVAAAGGLGAYLYNRNKDR